MTDLRNMLDAEFYMCHALSLMQIDIQENEFDRAMESQLEYLYWRDEFILLYVKHAEDYWKFKNMVKGIS